MKDPKTIFLLLVSIFISANSFGQLKNSKRFTIWQGGLCDETIILDSLGYFFRERGCEGNSTISFGKYKISKENIVSFHFLPMDSLHPIKEIKRYKDSNDSIITITLFDREEKPVNYAINLEAVDSIGKKQGVFTDKNGRVVLNRKLHKDLLIGPLLMIYGQQPALVIGEENNIEVHLSLPGLFLAYNEINIDKAYNLRLLLKQDGLYNLDRKTKIYSAAD